MSEDLELREEGTLDRVLDIVAHIEPPPLRERDAHALALGAARAARAARVARAQQASMRRRQTLWASAVVAVAAAVLMLAWPSSPSTREEADAHATGAPTAGAPMELSLPTGDMLTVTEGSKFELLAVGQPERRVSLTRGSVLFDVAPLHDVETFEVVTAHLTVHVRGTVFSVHTADRGTRVHVFEGHVMIDVVGDDGHRTHEVGAGESFESGHAPDVEPALARAGDHAAEVRSTRRARLATASESESAYGSESEPESAPASASSSASEPESASASEPESASASESASAVPSTPPSPTAASRLIAGGDAASALDIAHRALAEGGDRVRWGLVEADALRALHRFALAADAFDRVARLASPNETASRVGAGYRAAVIRRGDLHDPLAALASLDASEADAPSSPFAERALVLRAHALVELDRRAEARAVAGRYLEAFPVTAASAWMTELTAADQD